MANCSQGSTEKVQLSGRIDRAGEYRPTNPQSKQLARWHFCNAVILLTIVLVAAVSMASCGSTDPKADPPSQTPVISVKMSQFPPVSLVVANSVPVSASVGNDPANAGVDWVATCGSAPLCGSFSPSHTASGGTAIFTAPSEVPAQGTVAITALSSTNHGEEALAYVTILSGVSSVTITQPPPSSAPAGVAIILAATVLGDPANLGLDWTATCGSSGVQHTPVNCTSVGFQSGSHENAGAPITFIVPPPLQIADIVGSTVTFTASATADHKFSATALFTVTALPAITLSQVPPSIMLTNATAAVAAVVTGDSTNAGVTWSVGCQAAPCGSVFPTQTASGATATFTAPATVAIPNIVVTITATSTAAGQLVTATTNVTIIVPVSVKITQRVPTGSINDGGTAPLIATVTNDSENAGVDWTVNCGSAVACGSFSPAHTASGATTAFTAPSAVPPGNTVTITATSTADPSRSDAETVTITSGVPPDSELLGNFVILLTAKNSGNGPYVLGGLISGDGLGNITSGNVDLVDGSGNASPATAVPIISPSTYSIGADGRGQINLRFSTDQLSQPFGVDGSGAMKLSVVFVTPQHALLTEIDSFGAGTGTLDLQNAAALTAFKSGSWHNGLYSLALSGVEASSPYRAYSMASAATINFPSSSYSYVTDQSDKGAITSVPFTTVAHGFTTTRSQNGELSFFSADLGLPNQFNLDAWLIDATHFVVTDWRDSAGGEPSILVGGYLTAQPASTSISGSYAFTELGTTATANPQAAGGILACGSTGVLDVTPLGGTAISNAPVSTTCTPPSNGRGLFAVSGGTTGGIGQFAAYPTLDQGLYLIELDGGASGTSGPSGAGVARQQTITPAPLTAFGGKFASDFSAVTPLGFEAFAAQIVPDGVSMISGIADVNSFSASSLSGGQGAPSLGASLSGSFTGTPNGRFPLALNLLPANGQSTPEFTNINPACYIVDPDTCLLLGLDVNAPGTGIVQLQNPLGVVSLSPSAGSGLAQTFSVVVTDPSGAADLNNIQILFNATATRVSGCNVSYDVGSNSLSLFNDDASGFAGTLTPGSSGQVSNTQCTLSGMGSSYTTSGNTATLSVALTFSATFIAQQNAYIYMQNNSGLNNGGFMQWGTWTP